MANAECPARGWDGGGGSRANELSGLAARPRSEHGPRCLAPLDVLLVEDDAEVRDVLARLLTPGARVVGSAGDAASALAMAEAIDFDVALVDLGLPDLPGHRLIAELRRTRPSAACIALTVFDDETNILRALRAGARGYLLKSLPPARLGPALREACGGGAPLSPEIARLLVDRFLDVEEVGRESRRLTRRETDVLELLAKGLSYPDIARTLSIGLGTVQSHVRSVYQKLEISSKAEAAAFAVRAGLV